MQSTSSRSLSVRAPMRRRVVVGLMTAPDLPSLEFRGSALFVWPGGRLMDLSQSGVNA